MLEVPRYIVHATPDGQLSIQAEGKSAVKHRFTLRADPLRMPFGRELPTLLDDLVTVASTVYAVDRFIRRHGAEERGIWSWQRRLEVEVPVYEPERWNEPEVQRLLIESLNFFTEDVWEFKFYPREPSPNAGLQKLLFMPDSPKSAALFSGGLDSLAGLALQLLEGSEEPILTVSCFTNSRISRKQRQLLRALRGRSRARLMPIYLRPNLSQEGHDYNLNERSQRARGFLFHSLGIVGALMAGASEVLIYENGVGSINLPLSEAQLGAQSTRATHPVALCRLERFFCSLLGQRIHLRLPFLFLTKGQMCERLRESPFRSLALQTISCDSFPQRQKGPEQCGVCTSCLLRRESLWAAGFVEDRREGLYRHDVLGDMSAIPGDNLAPLWDMLSQVSKLERALFSATPWQSLAIEFPELQEIRDTLTDWYGSYTRFSIERSLVDLYTQYCLEWECFPARPVGCSANLSGLRLTA